MKQLIFSTVRCSIPHPTRGSIPIHPIHLWHHESRHYICHDVLLYVILYHHLIHCRSISKSIIRVFPPQRNFSFKGQSSKDSSVARNFDKMFSQNFGRHIFFVHTSVDLEVLLQSFATKLAKLFMHIASLKCWMPTGKKYSSITNVLLKTLDSGETWIMSFNYRCNDFLIKLKTFAP